MYIFCSFHIFFKYWRNKLIKHEAGAIALGSEEDISIVYKEAEYICSAEILTYLKYLTEAK